MDVEPNSYKPLTKPGLNPLTHAMHYKLKHSWLTLSHISLRIKTHQEKLNWESLTSKYRYKVQKARSWQLIFQSLHKLRIA